MMTLMPWLLGGVLAVIFGVMAFRQQNRKMRLGLYLLAGIAFGLVFEASHIFLVPYLRTQEFTATLQKEPLYALIAKERPQEYQGFIQDMKPYIKKGVKQDAIQFKAGKWVNQLFYQYLDKASDDTLVYYLESTLALYQYLALEDPVAILKLENERYPEEVDFNRLLADKNFQTLFGNVVNAKQQIIMLALTEPQDAHTILTDSDLLSPVFADLAEKYGQEGVKAMLSPQSNDIPPKGSAQFMIDFYAAVLNRGPEQAAQLLRFMAKSQM